MKKVKRSNSSNEFNGSIYSETKNAVINCTIGGDFYAIVCIAYKLVKTSFVSSNTQLQFLDHIKCIITDGYYSEEAEGSFISALDTSDGMDLDIEGNGVAFAVNFAAIVQAISQNFKCEIAFILDGIRHLIKSNAEEGGEIYD